VRGSVRYTNREVLKRREDERDVVCASAWMQARAPTYTQKEKKEDEKSPVVQIDVLSKQKGQRLTLNNFAHTLSTRLPHGVA